MKKKINSKVNSKEYRGNGFLLFLFTAYMILSSVLIITNMIELFVVVSLILIATLLSVNIINAKTTNDYLSDIHRLMLASQAYEIDKSVDEIAKEVEGTKDKIQKLKNTYRDIHTDLKAFNDFREACLSKAKEIQSTEKNIKDVKNIVKESISKEISSDLVNEITSKIEEEVINNSIDKAKEKIKESTLEVKKEETVEEIKPKKTTKSKKSTKPKKSTKSKKSVKEENLDSVSEQKPIKKSPGRPRKVKNTEQA